ncbi:MAG: tetratricopeptide repeat protein [Bryobacterales bacterium]|nr:tetratricopeptide repeat protein [Bryobacterales bacterium]
MAPIRLGLAAAALTLGVFAGSAQEDGPTAEALVRRGLMALQTRDLPTAQEFLERAVEKDPNEPRGWIGLAQTYSMLNLHAQASRHAAEAARLGGEDPVIQHALAMFHTNYGDWAEAAAWEEKFARQSERNRDAYLRTVSLYLQADMPKRAAEVGRDALQHGESAPLHNALGKAYTMAADLERGLRHLRLAVQQGPYEESLHYDLGYFHLRQQDFDAATAAFQAGRKFFDKSAALEIGLGIAAYGQRSFKDSVDHFLRAAELAPGLEQPHAFLGRLLQHASDRMDEVVGRMKVFHSEHSKNHFGPFLYGQALLAKLGASRDQAALAEIESLLRESLERSDEYWESHFELGVLLEKQRDFAEAEKHLERAVELNPDSSKPHYRLARVYQRLGKAREAKRERELHKRIAERERQAMQAGGLPEGFAGAGSTP